MDMEFEFFEFEFIFIPSQTQDQNATSTDYNRYLLGLTLIQTFLFVLLEVVGNVTLLSMILHEKFGMDPQKRTITNQILSSICGIFILFNIIVNPLWFIYR
jgi:uncharacterized membrane protein